MDDIVIERAPTTIMKLDDDEQALLDEIQVEPQRIKKAKAPKIVRPVQRQMEPDIDLDAFTNPNKQTAPPRPPPAETYDYGDTQDDEQEGDPQMDQDMGGGGGDDQPSAGYTSIEDEKADLLNKLARLTKKGFVVNQRLNAYSSVQELRTEYKRIMYGIEVDQSVKFSRRMMVACVSGLEFLNKRFNPIDLQLDGWSESVMENLDDYDGVFEELYVKYKTKMHVAPEVKLIMMLGGSAMMFHLTNSMFKAAIPNMSDVMKQNPELVKSMVQAVQNTKQPGAPSGSGGAPEPVRTDANGRREMKGPGFDISSLMGGIMMPPPPPMNTSLPPVREVREEDDSISDIVSVSGDSTGGEVRDVNMKAGARKRGPGRKKKNEVSI
jgi:Family of unknown function (DUF5767)